jgi:hypothetical protein
MPSNMAVKIAPLLADTNELRVTFRIDNPTVDIPINWCVTERKSSPRESKPKLAVTQENVGGLTLVLRNYRFSLYRVGVIAQYEDPHILRKHRMTFFWKKGATHSANLERTPGALKHMEYLTRKRLYVIEVYVDEDKTVGIYCKPH